MGGLGHTSPVPALRLLFGNEQQYRNAAPWIVCERANSMVLLDWGWAAIDGSSHRREEMLYGGGRFADDRSRLTVINRDLTKIQACSKEKLEACDIYLRR